MYIAILVLILLFIVFFIFCGISILIAGASLAPWFPINRKDIKRVDKLAALKKEDIFYDLGSGDGRVCRYIAMRNPEAKVIGIEMAYPMYLFSKLRNFFSPLKNLVFLYGNALNVDISNAKVVYIYGLPKTVNIKLKNKFLNELKTGTKIISYVFGIKKWDGETFTDKPTKKEKSLHVYKM